MGRVNQQHFTSGTASLVRQILFENTPNRRFAATLQDALAEVLVSDPIGHLQVFQRDQIVVLNQVGPQFMQVISALIGHMLLQQSFAAVLATPFLPGQ